MCWLYDLVDKNFFASRDVNFQEDKFPFSDDTSSLSPKPHKFLWTEAIDSQPVATFTMHLVLDTNISLTNSDSNSPPSSPPSDSHDYLDLDSLGTISLSSIPGFHVPPPTLAQ